MCKPQKLFQFLQGMYFSPKSFLTFFRLPKITKVKTHLKSRLKNEVAHHCYQMNWVNIRPEMNSNLFGISLRDKISLRCEVTSGVVKLTSVQISLRWFEISNHFEMSFPLHGNLHRDFAAASFQTIARPYCTCANDIF